MPANRRNVIPLRPAMRRAANSAARVFLCFDPARDAWRARLVAHALSMHGWACTAQKIGDGGWRAAAGSGPQVIDDWIRARVGESDATLLLLGAQTHRCAWSFDAIAAALCTPRALLGLRVHRLKDATGAADLAGPNPLDHLGWRAAGEAQAVPCSQYIRTYDWVEDEGFYQVAGWLCEAIATIGTPSPGGLERLSDPQLPDAIFSDLLFAEAPPTEPTPSGPKPSGSAD
jgi:hypothetical protein